MLYTNHVITIYRTILRVALHLLMMTIQTDNRFVGNKSDQSLTTTIQQQSTWHKSIAMTVKSIFAANENIREFNF